MSSISGVASFAGQVNDPTTATSVAAPVGPPPGPPPQGVRHHHKGGKAALDSALEQLLGKSDQTTALEQKIQDSVDQVLKNGGTMEDVRSTVDNLLKEAGVDPGKLQQLMHPRDGDSGTNADAAAGIQVSATRWQTTATSPLGSLLLPGIDKEA
jgi:hypothetical protein